MVEKLGRGVLGGRGRILAYTRYIAIFSGCHLLRSMLLKVVRVVRGGYVEC